MYCCHELDFVMAAELQFFATSHGLDPCDGVCVTIQQCRGLTIVRAVRLQRAHNLGGGTKMA